MVPFCNCVEHLPLILLTKVQKGGREGPFQLGRKEGDAVRGKYKERGSSRARVFADLSLLLVLVLLAFVFSS